MAITPSSRSEQERLLDTELAEERVERTVSSARKTVGSLSRGAVDLARRVNDINRAFEQNSDPEEIERQVDDLEERLKTMELSAKPPKKEKKTKKCSKTVDAVILSSAVVGTVLFGYYAPGHPMYTILTMLAAGTSKTLMSKLSVVQQISFHVLCLPTGYFVSRYTPLQAMTVSSALALSVVKKSLKYALLGKEVPANEVFKGQVKAAWEQTSERANPYVATSQQWAQGAREQAIGWITRAVWGAPRATTLGGANNV